jgi:hypothetical protein
MKAYFIDAKNEFIVDVDVKNYEHKKELIKCRMLEVYPYQINGNDIWVDEEGNLKDHNYYFQIDNDVVVSGNAVIMSCDDEGESKPPKDLTLEELKSRVNFIGKLDIDPTKLKFEVVGGQ